MEEILVVCLFAVLCVLIAANAFRSGCAALSDFSVSEKTRVWLSNEGANWRLELMNWRQELSDWRGEARAWRRGMTKRTDF